MFDFSIVTNWIHEMLLSVMPEGWAIFIECIAVGVCIVALYAILAIVLIYMERKVCGFFQCRLGPNRVGKWGSIQVICDVLKMLTKEIFTPKDADRFLYNLAPFMVIIASVSYTHLDVYKRQELNSSTKLGYNFKNALSKLVYNPSNSFSKGREEDLYKSSTCPVFIFRFTFFLYSSSLLM